MNPCALYQRLAETFAKHARYYAKRQGVDANDFEAWMWEVTLAKGAGTVHKCGSLLSQTPAYIATWAARYAIKCVQQQWHAEMIDESMTYQVAPSYTDEFTNYLEQIGEAWGIDVSQAIRVIDGGSVSPAFEQYIRSLGPQDKRIAVLLLSGLKCHHIYDPKHAPNGQRLAKRGATKRIHQELYQVLKKAA